MSKYIDGNKYRLAHAKCVENHNDTIQCGLDHGDCGSPDCALSRRYAGPPANEDARWEAIKRLNASE